MKLTRITLCITAALLFMGALFRPGCRIILSSGAMPGIYDPAAVYRCDAAARRTADEITRSTESPDYTIVPVLCLKNELPDEQLLYHILLEAYPGVEKLYKVCADGTPVGLLGDLADVIALRRLYPERKVSFTETYTYTDAESTAQEVREAMNRLGSTVGPF